MEEGFKQALIDEFRAMASRYSAPGWIEYLFWETVEGLRDRPFPLLEALPPDEMEVLRMLRDDAQIWVFWRDGQWFVVDIESWRVHTRSRSAHSIMTELCNAGG